MWTKKACATLRSATSTGSRNRWLRKNCRSKRTDIQFRHLPISTCVCVSKNVMETLKKKPAYMKFEPKVLQDAGLARDSVYRDCFSLWFNFCYMYTVHVHVRVCACRSVFNIFIFSYNVHDFSSFININVFLNTRNNKIMYWFLQK